MNTKYSCFNCGAKGADLFGYIICDSCKSKLRLFTDETINKYISEYDNEIEKSYEEEINFRLDFIEKDHIKKRIKLLHILERLEDIN